MFDAAWIGAQDQMEYPFALAYKYGYRDDDYPAAVARDAADARKFTLVDAGLVGSPTCKLLIVNGMEDAIFPIEDSLIVATDGRGKDLIMRGDRGHMGDPGAGNFLYEWIDNAVAGTP